MKKLIAIAALLAATQASAFWGWNDAGQYGYGNVYNDGRFDGVGDAQADFAFDFDMTGRMSWEGDGYGNARGYGAGDGYGYGYHGYMPYHGYGVPYGYPPLGPPVGGPPLPPPPAE